MRSRRDEPLAPEHLDGLAQGAAADLQRLAKLRLRRQVSGLGVVAAQDGAREALDDLLVDARLQRRLRGFFDAHIFTFVLLASHQVTPNL
jgi:hypothetical protein